MAVMAVTHIMYHAIILMANTCVFEYTKKVEILIVNVMNAIGKHRLTLLFDMNSL